MLKMDDVTKVPSIDQEELWMADTRIGMTPNTLPIFIVSLLGKRKATIFISVSEKYPDFYRVIEEVSI